MGGAKMINFIVCDDEKKYVDLIDQIITKVMMKNKVEYDIHKFYDYDKRFMDSVNKKLSFKVYVLDIETPTKSGIDVARIIRYKDVNSVIIFLTGHDELGETIIKDELLILTFINKFNDCEKRLTKALEKSLTVVKVKNIIKFKDCGTIYTIALEDILYITRDSAERKVIIATDYGKLLISKSLTYITKMLNDNFIQTHRACIVNKRRIVSYNKRKKKIMFDNGEDIDLISPKFEKNIW